MYIFVNALDSYRTNLIESVHRMEGGEFRSAAHIKQGRAIKRVPRSGPEHTSGLVRRVAQGCVETVGIAVHDAAGAGESSCQRSSTGECGIKC